MDEVQAMTHAGETVGRAVGTGVRTLRRNAVHAGHAGAEVAARAAAAVEQKLAETGQEAAKELKATTKRAKRDLAKSGENASRRAGRGAKKTARRMQDTISDLAGVRKRRRWPWLLAALGVAAAGTAVVAVTRKPAEPVLVEEPQEQDHSSGNGAAPEPRQEQKQLDRKS